MEDFVNRMQVNDIVAMKNGGELIALVQVIGGSYEVHNDPTETEWIVYRRPIQYLIGNYRKILYLNQEVL